MEIESGPLLMDLDTGLVRRRDTEAETLEAVGPIFDADACPHGLESHWYELLDAWNDSLGGGHAREAEWSWYERLSIANWN